jgi:hypothetical protein
LAQKQPTHLPTQIRFARSITGEYIAVMASRATIEIEAEPNHEAQERGASLDFEIRSIGRSLPRTDAPEGWVKKVNRAREGKVWVGYFHVWEATPDGRRVRRKKEKTLGPATRPRHEALEELSEYIAEHTGKLAKQGEAITTFAELWKAYRAVKSGQWSKKTPTTAISCRSSSSTTWTAQTRFEPASTSTPTAPYRPEPSATI